METTVFILILAVYVLLKGFDLFTGYLNNKARDRKIPDIVSDVYDKEDYEKWRAYTKENHRLKLLSSLIGFAVIFAMLLFGGFTALAAFTLDNFQSPYVRTLIFIGILYGAFFLMSLPFNIYRVFSIEERYGFNKTTPQTFVKDLIKSLLLTIIFSGGVLLLLVHIFENFGNLFILLSFIALMVISLVINIAYVKVILPLFNKLTPLEDNELKQKIQAIAESENYAIKKIHVMDASKRSTKLNAFFSGFGRFKNVVLFDTLLEKMDDEMILSVLAHEIGHAKHKDVVKNIFFSAFTLAVMLSLLYLFLTMDIFYRAFGLEQFHFGFLLVIFGILTGPVNLLIGIIANKFSRKAEYKADAFAAEKTTAEDMIKALKVLARENYADLTPHELYVFLHYSHPPIKERIRALEE